MWFDMYIYSNISCYVFYISMYGIIWWSYITISILTGIVVY